MKILITGGAGFIGSAFIRHLIPNTLHRVMNIDKLTYSGNLASLECLSGDDRYSFEQVDITNRIEIERIFSQYQPDVAMYWRS